MTLFDQQGDGLSLAYQRLRDDESCMAADLRDLLDAQWRAAEAYLDTNFRTAFSRETAQRFWELRLISLLMAQGFDLEPARQNRPDVSTRLPDGRRLWIEATAPTLGAATNPDRPPELRRGFQAVPVERLLLRLSQGIYDKTQRLRRYREQEIIAPDDVVVIALSSGDHWPYIEAPDHPRIINVVFPIGNERVVIDSATGDVLHVEHSLRSEVVRVNGERIPMTAFDSPASADISGLIYDFARPVALGQQDWKRFFTIENPYAQAPLPRHYLPVGRAYWVDGDRQLRWYDHPSGA